MSLLVVFILISAIVLNINAPVMLKKRTVIFMLLLAITCID